MKSPNEDLVERLVRLAEPGPEIPIDGAARIKSAVRPLWQREVRARTRRRAAGWGIAAAAVATIVLLLPERNVPAHPPVPIGSFELVRGDVRMNDSGGQGHPAANGASVPAGAEITTAAEGRAALRLAGGTTLRLDGDTTISLLSPRAVALSFGAVYVETSESGALEVRTPAGIARDIGTRFEVRHEGDELLVRVREGAVALDREGTDLRIDEGSEVTVRTDGSHLARRLSAHAEEWSWPQSAAPPYAIEGRTVSSFLLWVSRETGWTVRYADAESERLAAETVLHGTLGDLRPDQAPELILPSAGLEAGHDSSGALVVRRARH